jgi:hypothetical protein
VGKGGSLSHTTSALLGSLQEAGQLAHRFFSVLAASTMATRKKKNKHQMGADDVVTGAGQGKDQYGRRFGKKHASAMMEFTKNLWLQDSTTSLRNLLQKEVAQNKFREFLATEYGEAQLDFFLDIQRLQYVPHEQQPPIIMGIYNNFM